MHSANLRAFIRHLRKVVHPDGEHELTDAELLERFVRSRDEAAFEALIRRHGAMVLGVCRRLLRSEQDVEDAFQATFLTLVRKAGFIRKRDAVASWLYKVTYRVALAAQATANARAKREQTLGDTTPVDPAADPAWSDLRAVFDQEINHLPAKYRAPVVLCYLEGKTNHEAARQLGCAKGTLFTRLAWARQHLRRRLARRGVTLSAATLTLLFADEATFAAAPAALVELTVLAARAGTAGGATVAGGAISVRAAALAEGVLRAMFVTKMKTATAVLLPLALLGFSGTAVTYHRAAQHVAAGGDTALRTVAEANAGKADGREHRAVEAIGVSRQPEGTRVSEEVACPADVPRLIRKPDGSQIIRTPDDSQTIQTEDGSRTIQTEDGSRTIQTEDGSRTIQTEDGSRTIRRADRD
jgi:RNA polymerase sigma factor (sigma-70 family)